MRASWWTTCVGVVAALSIGGCRDIGDGLDPANPARGPGQLVGNGEPITNGEFAGGNDTWPAPAGVEPPTGGAIDCDGACRAYCDAQALDNPINRGACPSLWGVGLASQPLDRTEACRRLYVDILGRYPSPSEVNGT